MRAEYINPFVDGAFAVLHEVLGVAADRGELRLKSTTQPIMEVTTVVGLTGAIEGRILFEMSEPTALAIAGVMNDEEFQSFDELAKATITELSNMIAARAVTELDKLGFDFDLSPPALLTGDDMQVSDGGFEALIIPLTVPQGELEINVVLRDRRTS